MVFLIHTELRCTVKHTSDLSNKTYSCLSWIVTLVNCEKCHPVSYARHLAGIPGWTVHPSLSFCLRCPPKYISKILSCHQQDSKFLSAAFCTFVVVHTLNWPAQPVWIWGRLVTFTVQIRFCVYLHLLDFVPNFLTHNFLIPNVVDQYFRTSPVNQYCQHNTALTINTDIDKLKSKKPTRCHVLFYCTSYRLNMFRALLCPSSGARDYDVDYHIGLFFLVCYRLEVRCG